MAGAARIVWCGNTHGRDTLDKAEAAALLRHELQGYARRSHSELAGLIGDVDAYGIEGASSVEYQIEVSAHWDAEPGGTIRVIGSIDDGGFWCAFRPVADGFLIDADGTVDMPDA